MIKHILKFSPKIIIKINSMIKPIMLIYKCKKKKKKKKKKTNNANKKMKKKKKKKNIVKIGKTNLQLFKF